MTEEAWLELMKPLGVAIPLVAILFYLLRQATEERQSITKAFLTTLQETVKSSSESSLRLSVTFSDMTDAIRLSEQRHSAEHTQIVETLRQIQNQHERRP